MKIRFKKTSSIFDVGVTAVAAILSVGVMLYGVLHFGLSQTWPELVLNLLYIACLVMMGMYFFYSRKAWKTYSKSNLWLIFVIDLAIAILYNVDISLEPANEYTNYMLVEIWIRPTISYGLVACFVKETNA